MHHLRLVVPFMMSWCCLCVAKRVALQLSGHLRHTCSSEHYFAMLQQSVLACRHFNEVCHVFLHTWDRLQASTPSWHTPNVAESLSSAACAHRIALEIGTASSLVEVPPSFDDLKGTELWWTRAKGNTNISLAGIASAIYSHRKVRARSSDAHRLAQAFVAAHPQFCVRVALRPTTSGVSTKSGGV